MTLAAREVGVPVAGAGVVDVAPGAGGAVEAAYAGASPASTAATRATPVSPALLPTATYSPFTLVPAPRRAASCQPNER